MRRYRIGGMMGLASLAFACTVWAIPVEVTNPVLMVHDEAVSAQTALTAAREFDIIKNQITDLASLADLSGYAEEIGAAQALLSILQQVSGRLLGRYSKWLALFPMGGGKVPCTVKDLLDWNANYDQETSQALSDGYQAQGIISQSNVALNIIVNLIKQAAGMHGSVQGLQSLNGVLGTLVTESVRMETSTNSFHESLLRTQAKEIMDNQADVLIEKTALSGITGEAVPECPMQ